MFALGSTTFYLCHYYSYRLTTDERGSGEGSAATSSKSSSTLTATSGEQPSTSRRLAWGGGRGGSLKKRSGPAKAASFSGSNVGSVKITRSSSKEKVPSGEPIKEKDKGRDRSAWDLLFNECHQYSVHIPSSSSFEGVC